MVERPLTSTQLLASATDFLVDGGYRRISPQRLASWDVANSRVFEDAYGIVAVAVYETWEELTDSWPEAQGALVDLISEYVPAVEAKAWEGYLVLLSPGGVSEEAANEATTIRYDMSRVRKLVGTGIELTTLSGVERVLRPLLPLAPHPGLLESGSALDLLPELVSSDQIPEQAVRVAVDAFVRGDPIVEALHKWRTDA